jgi:hypothetical protein
MGTPTITRRATLKFANIIALAVVSGGRVFPRESPSPAARGYGRDPNLFQRPVTWPRTLNVSQLAALAALCEIILPAEPLHPSAAAIGVHDFLDEWVSAPYPQMQLDRPVIIQCLTDLDEEARLKFGVPFSATDRAYQTAAFDSCCNPNSTSAHFAERLIQLVCGGYYTTREGLAAIGYVGNTALASFPVPPPEVIRRFSEALKQL